VTNAIYETVNKTDNQSQKRPFLRRNSTILMEIKYETRNGRIEAHLSEKSDWDLFNQIAELITKKFNVSWIERVDGLDQRYWDFEIEGERLTLHLGHYLGTSLFPTKDGTDKAKQLVQRIGDYLETKTFEKVS